MWIVRVKDRGRDLSVHTVEGPDEADEVRRVYQALGYAAEKIVVEQIEPESQAA